MSRTRGDNAPSTASFEEDHGLFQLLKIRDRKATARFVAEHSDAIYGYVRFRLAPRRELTDDVVQEVFLAAWKNLDSYRGQSSLRTWLLGIARHKVEDVYRQRLREPDPLDPQEPPSEIPESQPHLDFVLDRESAEARIQEILRALPEHYGMVLLWRYWEERSIRDIALAVGRTEKSIERTLARARSLFRRRWEDANR